MADVAGLAGVSHQTVSRVLNRHPNVSDRTRVRVLAAVQELGYRPNRAARALATGRSDTLGIIAQGSTLHGPASMQAAFGQAAAEVGFAVSVASLREFDPQSISRAVDTLLAQRVAGIAVHAPAATPRATLSTIPPDLPVVLIDTDPDTDRSVVWVDQVRGARLATQHLLELGHATVWHVSGPAGWFDSTGRVEGWRQALQDAGREAPPPLLADWTAAAGYEAGQVIARMPDATAVFAANDHLALGLMLALGEHGKRIPDDISLVGFDDVPESAFFRPPLTTIRQDFAALARTALDVLLGHIDGKPVLHRTTISPELVVRASTGPPPGSSRWRGDLRALA
jgi:DNA-binding LacI/PurR family transcriptional regulator